MSRCVTLFPVSLGCNRTLNRVLLTCRQRIEKPNQVFKALTRGSFLSAFASAENDFSVAALLGGGTRPLTFTLSNTWGMIFNDQIRADDGIPSLISCSPRIEINVSRRTSSSNPPVYPDSTRCWNQSCNRLRVSHSRHNYRAFSNSVSNTTGAVSGVANFVLPTVLGTELLVVGYHLLSNRIVVFDQSGLFLLSMFNLQQPRFSR